MILVWRAMFRWILSEFFFRRLFMSENQYSSKPKHVLLECFIFHKKKSNSEAEMELLTRKLMISWSRNTSKGWINSPKSLFFYKLLGQWLFWGQSRFFFLSPLYCRNILKSRIFVIVEWERFFERCIKIYHRLGKPFSALFFSLMMQTASNWDSPWHAWHFMCKPGF